MIKAPLTDALRVPSRESEIDWIRPARRNPCAGSITNAALFVLNYKLNKEFKNEVSYTCELSSFSLSIFLSLFLPLIHSKISYY